MKKNKKKKTKKIGFLLFLLGLLLITWGSILTYYNKLLVEYKDKTFKNTYINGYDFSLLSFDEVSLKLKEIENDIYSKEIVFYNSNEEVKVKFADVGLAFNAYQTLLKIKENQTKMSFINKILMQQEKTINDYNLEVYFDRNKLDTVLGTLENSFNKEMHEDRLVIANNYALTFIEGNNGFKLNYDDTKQKLNDYLTKYFKTKQVCIDMILNYKIAVSGDEVLKQANNLGSINKKISSYTTNFENSGNRGYNVRYAASLLNGTILNPGDTFSFRRVVGPYSCSNGFKPAPSQSPSGVDCGGGVCQVSTTLYNAQLLAGLETVSRTNHGSAVPYVPRGRDATVYGNTTDYRFRNQYNFPVYIIARTSGNNLIIDIWSNESVIAGKSYDISVSKLASGGYATYLLTYQNGTLVNKKYLHTSFYR